MNVKLSGWGRTKVINANVFRPRHISELIGFVKRADTKLIAYGCGRSYGDEALNASATTIITTHLNHFTAFDTHTMELICEAGVTLHDIQYTFLPRGYALITCPGTAWVTIGGAIANDVHGKNHDRVGSFGNHILWFDLLLASGEIIQCSRTENSAVFFATIGGMGLTGIITRACLKLQKQPIAVQVKNETIQTVPELMSKLCIAKNESTYSVAWIDLSKKNFGRSILSTGEPSSIKMELSDKKTRHIPTFARLFLNSFSITLFNRFYYLYNTQKNKKIFQSLPTFLHPLDVTLDWNMLYGKKGFYQFQCVIPENFSDEGIVALLNTVRASSHICFLAVLKTLGDKSEGLLSFPLSGFTLALDFPNKAGILELLKKLEAITLHYQGRIYVAKDACMSAESLIEMYPKLTQFKKVLSQVDPEKKWESDCTKRLKIRNYD